MGSGKKESSSKELKTIIDRLEFELKERRRMEAALKESEKRLRYLSDRLLAAQETERRRVSRELHDGLGGGLVTLKLRLDFIKKNLPEDQIKLKAECEEDLQLVDQIMDEVHQLCRDLSPSIIEDLGLNAALQWLIRNFIKDYKIKGTFDNNGLNLETLFPRKGQIHIYRIFQEALENIGKYAQAENVLVVIKNLDDKISFSVEDDGKGFNVTKARMIDSPEKGLGLVTMDERARMLGGTLDLWSQEGKGTKLTVCIPMKIKE